MMSITDSQREPKVYISVVNWNGYANTIACLQALITLHYSNYKIVVVDNHSSDDSVAQIQAAFPNIEIICAPTNLGFAGGHRLALEQARTDSDAVLFWMLNNDAFVEPVTLNEIVSAYQRFGDCLYGSVPLNTSARTIDALSGFELAENGEPMPSRNLEALAGLDYDLAFPQKTPLLVTQLHGSSFFIPLKVIQQYGFMDEQFFLYAEENDYCYRLRTKGVKCILVPTSVTRHIHSASTRANADLKRVVVYYSLRNYLLFSRRHHSAYTYYRNVFSNVQALCRDLAKSWHSFVQHSDSATSERKDLLYRYLALKDALLNHTGKTIAPEDFYHVARNE